MSGNEQKKTEKNEPKQDDTEIRVGDEVRRDNKSAVIIRFTENGWALGMDKDGYMLDVNLSFYKKTGRHYDIESILKQMQEG